MDGQCECGLESDEDGCGGEEKERKNMWGKSDEDGCRGRRRKGRLKRRWMDSVNVVLRVMRMDVDGRRKGRLKRRWMDSVNVDLRVMRMDVEGGEGKED